MAVTVETLPAHRIEQAIDALARLRIAVFAEWPYLYVGDADYERDYLAEFAAAPEAALIVARDGDEIVGAATASPLAAQKPEFKAPFVTAGWDIARTFYFGESVLLPGYRGQGIGHAFFDHREAASRAAGARVATFCAVQRPADHGLRPAGYRPLDAFWTKRGYAKVEGLVTSFDWLDIGETQETPHPMQFWAREL
ncbi:MAG: GNAT family acetyltransferase [Blastomonas sp. CACIA14H2]|uniref:GNAT family N-acetyltransferase n=1 Tax=Blastomonas sp. CACIA14H2 TaxID=1419876 RepID=UPI0003CFD1EF|nr:MAG: GNAT family acetyltransferase [Blastomonas sp. CACIA14H2]